MSTEMTTPRDDTLWRRVVRDLADDLAVDAHARDRAGRTPLDEVERLREAGLTAFLTASDPAAGPGGHGADLRTACTAVRELSAADSSVGELLAHHYALSWTGRFLTAPGTRGAEPFARLDARTAAEGWLLAGATEPAPRGTGPGLTLTRADRGGWLLDGRRSYDSAVAVADRLVVAARPAGTGDLLLVLVDPAHPGVRAEPAADRVGQRLTGAGTVAFDQVPVPRSRVLGTVPADEHAVAPFTSLAPLVLRLLLVHVALGIAEGALAEARDVTRARPPEPGAAPGDDRPAAGGPADRGDDPYLLLSYGELATSAHTAAAVAERATDALARGLRAGWALGVEERADLAVVVSAAETVTGRAAVRLTTRILELVEGAPPAAPGAGGGGPGFDRFWRNARALTARTRPAHRLRDIGDHYLHGSHARLARSA
ncbi:FMNH2-dependent monooxygenase [Streptomyces termitum]|uniref:FMNH2-dependent monooxygenase n=2 Tax=Streptomyces termitum TaxID=67368 RepID=A0A918T2B4_9ACTN|nr:FMNH2-dependent monooxygenase [Streptomyces termitum]